MGMIGCEQEEERRESPRMYGDTWSCIEWVSNTAEDTQYTKPGYCWESVVRWYDYRALLSNRIKTSILVLGTTPYSNRRLNSVGGDCDWFQLEVSVPNEDVQRDDGAHYYDNREESTTKHIKANHIIHILQLLGLPVCSSMTWGFLETALVMTSPVPIKKGFEWI